MARSSVIALLLLLIATPAIAQTTRAEAIAAEQQAKAGRLTVEGPSEGERVVRRILTSPLLAGGDGAYPWFGSVFGGSGMASGAGYLKRLPNAASASVTAGVSVNKSMLMEGRFSAPELWRGKVRVDGLARWIDVKDVSFFGLGQASSVSQRDRYDYQPTEFGGDVSVTPKGRLSFGGGYSWLGLNTTAESGTTHRAPGIGEALQYHVTRGSVAFDSRTSPGYNTRGGFYSASISRHDERTGQPFSFRTEEYEVVQLLPLVREQFVLAFRGLATFTQPDGGDDVPVVLSPFLGSGSTLRGFRNRRFTDRQLLLFTGEYRWRPSRYLDMAVFLDAGQVAPERRDLRLDALDTSWGIGARFHKPTFTAFRVEVARGREGIALVFGGAQSF